MKTNLLKMTEEEFDQYMSFIIPDYANDLSANYMMPLEKAMAESKDLMVTLFPNKQNSDGQFVSNIYSVEEGKTIGMLWYHIQAETNDAFIYHIYIKEESRQKGYGSYVLQDLEATLRNAGITSLGLNVFGTNPDAFRLYEKLGYQPASTFMKKSI